MPSDARADNTSLSPKAAAWSLTSEALQGRLPVQLLRGLEEPGRTDGDLDLIVPPARARQACLLVASAAIRRGWYVTWFRDMQYVCSIAIALPGDGEPDFACKLDFQDGFAWHGLAGNTDITDPFGSRWSAIHENWADKRAIGAQSFLIKLMASGRVSDRDWARIASSGADAPYIASVAQRLDMPLTASDIEGRRIGTFGKWRLRAASAGAAGVLRTASWFVRACIAYVMAKSGFWLHSGLALGFSGLDGSGKSAVAARLVALYASAGVPATEIHLLPSWLPMPHQIFRRKKTSANYEKPYSEPPVRSRLNGWIRLGYYMLLFVIAKWATWWACARGRLVVYDRTVLDFVSDLTRARIPSGQLPGAAIKALTPRGLFMFVDASPDVVVRRKGELTLEKALTLRARYERVARVAAMKRVDGDLPPADLFRAVLGLISAEYMHRIALAQKAGAREL